MHPQRSDRGTHECSDWNGDGLSGAVPAIRCRRDRRSGFTETLALMIDRVAEALTGGHKCCWPGMAAAPGTPSISRASLSAGSTTTARPLAAIALTTDTSVITATGNDYGYDRIFERQVLGLGNPGRRADRDFNLRLLAEHPARDPRAREQGLLVIGFAGHSGGDMAAQCDLCLRARPM